MRDLGKLILAVILTVAIVTALNIAVNMSCNPKGSLAAQISWAGRPECISE